MASMYNLQNQVQDLVSSLYDKSGHESRAELSKMVDFRCDTNSCNVVATPRE